MNQKSELQRALEKQREAASRREAERSREESYKDDPRTALQRAIEQRARHIQITVYRAGRNVQFRVSRSVSSLATPTSVFRILGTRIIDSQWCVI